MSLVWLKVALWVQIKIVTARKYSYGIILFAAVILASELRIICHL